MGGTSSSPRAESSSNRQGAFSPAPPYVNQNPSHVTQHDHCTDIPVYDHYPSYPPPRDKYSSHASPGDQYPSYPPPHDKYSSHASPGDQYPSYPPQSDYAPQSSYAPQSNYAPQSSYAPQPSYAPSPQSYGHQSANPKRKLDKRYSMIADQYSSFDQVTEALAQSGLESSNLIVGIDFTKSNEWTGSRSFNRKSLHHIGDIRNPYEKAMSIIGRTLSAFDDDNLIPCFGFGDASTHDQDVFSFYPDGRSCYGFEEALARYREIVPHLRLAGPTSFAPIIEMAMTIVEQSGGQYHVLLIIADGQVTRSINTLPGQLSPQEQKTVDAIVKASEYPLSIILVGVGDGPWDMMKEFDDNIPARAFDNFQFVNFTEIMSKSTSVDKSEREFAVTALMEIPSQYKATVELGLLSRKRGNAPQRIPLPPPMQGRASLGSKSSFQTSLPPPYPRDQMSMGTAPPESSIYPDVKSMGTAPSESSAFDNQVCPICLTERKDMAFGCGHQTCRDCGRNLELCPICRTQIQTRIKLY